MPRRSAIDVARDRAELARLKLAAAVDARRLASFNARYDATESNRHRRQPEREFQSEGGIYDMTRRLLGCNLGRDLERNYSPAKAIMHQFRINVVGTLAKIRIKAGEAGETATAWFNEVWAKDCDYRDDNDWQTTLGSVLNSAIREGDMMGVVDDGVTSDDTGKLLTWEADQIVPASDEVAKRLAGDGVVQDNGIVRDRMGRVLGYIVTGKRGVTLIDKAEDATFYKRGVARLFSNPWRLNQGRGVPALLTSSSNLIDLYEILASELQTAKRAAKDYAFVKRDNATTDFDDPASGPEFLNENDGRMAADVATDGANETTKTGARNYESLEALTGGYTDYLSPLDSVEFPKVDRPNIHLAEFIEAVNGIAGASMGLARAYTILRADSSYTSFRGDMLLSWQTFYWLQKQLERRFCDWVAIRVLNWAQRKKQIPALPAGWERAISWTWPVMPEVDELDAQNAIAAALKNGTTDYGQLLGPDWQARLAELAKQTDFIRASNLPLKQLETASGGVVDNPKKRAADGAKPATQTQQE